MNKGFMNSNDMIIWMINSMIISFLVVFFMYLGRNRWIEEGYIKACNDFYNGKLKYDAKQTNSGKIIWVKVEENKTK